MLEQMVSYESHSNEVFNLRLKEIYDVLLNYQQNIKFGPRFHVETVNKPEDLCIQSFFVENIRNTETNFDNSDKSLILIATDLNDQLIGYRVTHFHQINNENFYCLGEINVLKSGLGYATEIELCHMHILQKEANDSNAAIKYHIEDGNKYTLAKFENLHLQGKIDIGELNKKINERNRWKNLYGQGGLLDFVEGKKEFFPNDQIYTKYNYKNTSDVFLERKDYFKSDEKKSIGLFKKCYGKQSENEPEQDGLSVLNNFVLSNQ